MKRWPLVASFVLFIALCATLAYWAMQVFKPPLRPVAAPPPSAQAPVNIDAAASLFGGKGSTAVASNFQLKGIIMAGNPADSVAILAADGKPAQAVRANAELQPGIKVKEVSRRFVILLDNGVEKRVELPEDSKQAGVVEATRTAPIAKGFLPARPAPAMPTTVVDNPAPDSANPSAPQSAATANSPSNTGPSSTASSATANASPGSAAGPAAVPQQASTPPANPGAGMGSPPIVNQGSPGGMGQISPGAANPVKPGMPVPAPPPPR